ncbi:MAG: hypothetical protein IPK76_00845 [Lewinellaceae bacterium]|nr:hypothetical protein [Lewinellaceae bacterium]
MKSIPLLQILRALPASSMRALEKFVQSPYHVTHSEVLRLFRHLKANKLDDVSTAALARTFAADGRRMYHLNNYLLEAVERFLALEIWEQRPHDRNLATVEHLRRLHLDNAGASMLRYTQKRLEADPQRGRHYHRSVYLLHLESYYLSQQEGRARTANVQELTDAEDIAFICEKLRTGCLLLSHQAVTKREYNTGLLENVLQFLKGHRYLDIPIVAAYYHGYYAQSGTDSESHFMKMKTLIQQYAGRFSLAETHDLYLMAINFCIRRINQADEHYFREVFELYRSGLQHGALLENGTLSRWTYNNIAVTAIRLREFEWVERFLNDFAAFLPESHREGAYNFNMARFYYDTGDYPRSMQHLLRMEYDDVLQNLVAKTMLCKIYYELDENDALENQLDSIQIYLRRKKVLGYHKDNYTAIVRYLRKLLAINPNSAAEKEKLRQEIEEAPVLTEREWLLKHLDVPADKPS